MAVDRADVNVSPLRPAAGAGKCRQCLAKSVSLTHPEQVRQVKKAAIPLIVTDPDGP